MKRLLPLFIIVWLFKPFDSMTAVVFFLNTLTTDQVVQSKIIPVVHQHRKNKNVDKFFVIYPIEDGRMINGHQNEVTREDIEKRRLGD
jgi:hypothetical protein